MITDHHISGHLDEGDLRRLLDEPGAETAGAAEHLRGCAVCARRLEAMRAEASDFSDLLSALPVPPLSGARRERSWEAVRRASVKRAMRPQPRRWTGAWRAAAGVAAIVAGAFATTPALAWIAERWSDMVAAEEPAQPRVAEVVRTEAPARQVVSFIPQKDAFSLELASAQRVGSLSIEIADVETVTAEVIGGAEQVEVTVLPGAVRIENHPGSTAGYRVIVPSHLRHVNIRIGGAPPVGLPANALAAPWRATIDLGEVTGTQTPLSKD